MQCPFPLSASPYVLGDLTAQFWLGPPTTHTATTVVHMLSPALKFSGLLQRGLRTGWKKHKEGRSTQFLLLFLCSVDMTPPYLLLLCLMAHWTSPKVWCPFAALSIHTKRETPPVKLGWPVLGKKRQKKPPNKTKMRVCTRAQLWSRQTATLFPQRPPQKLSTLPLPSPYRYQSLLHNRKRIRTALQLMLIQSVNSKLWWREGTKGKINKKYWSNCSVSATA